MVVEDTEPAGEETVDGVGLVFQQSLEGRREVLRLRYLLADAPLELLDKLLFGAGPHPLPLDQIFKGEDPRLFHHLLDPLLVALVPIEVWTDFDQALPRHLVFLLARF